MGLLSEGSPLEWSETKKWADHVRDHGITQFINLYHRLKNRWVKVYEQGRKHGYPSRLRVGRSSAGEGH